MFEAENFNLKDFNTFRINAICRHFVSFSSVHELYGLFDKQIPLPVMILGGGSNVLFAGNFDGLVLKNDIPGIEQVDSDDDYIYIRVGAGENWHRFVTYCVERDWGGLENLSLIPGSAGASPMQNIGAYGVEIKDVFHSLEAFHLEEKKIVSFSASDCEFGYRDSIFKNKYRDQFVILNVVFRLTRHHNFSTAYGAITEELEKMGVKDLSIKAISQAVINIRSSKLPDPAVIGNAGSFFKNPVISEKKYLELKEKFPDIIAFKSDDGQIKLAGGRLIEQCGWKGYRRGDAGCYVKQALVLVNYGNATGKEILELGEEISDSVNRKFGIMLEREVNVV